MHSCNQVFYELEYNNFDSHFLPWYYSSDDPYGEPFQYTQQGLYNESNSVYDEAGDGTVECGSNWINEYTSYFARCSFDDEITVGARDINPCPSNHLDFVDETKDSYSITGNPNQPPEDSDNEDSWDYVGLWESIFCFSPFSNAR